MMWRSAQRIAIGGLVFLLLAWMLLNSAVFATVRIAVVEWILSEVSGHRILVQDDVRIAPGRNSRVTITSLVLPGEGIQNLTLAEVDQIEFDIRYTDLLRGTPEPHNISVKGLRLSVIEQEVGRKGDNAHLSTKGNGAPRDDLVFEFNGETPHRILMFLADRRVDVTEASVFVSNQSNGFEFDILLSDFQLRQDNNSGFVTLNSHGAVNGAKMSFEGRYGAQGSFQNTARVGGLLLRYDGERLPNSKTGGFAGDLSLSSKQKGAVFEILALDSLFGATGVVNARVESDEGYVKVAGLNALIDLEHDKRLNLRGKVSNLYTLEGLQIDVDYHFLPEGSSPEPAKTIFDIKLSEINAKIVKKPTGVGVTDIVLSTNAFHRQFREIGPISLGKVTRTEDGKLSLADVNVQLGPSDNPYLLASGSINDALNARDFQFEGRLLAPSSLFFPRLDPSRSAAFGQIVSTFVATDDPGYLTISEFSASALDTDLWELDATFLVDDLSRLENLSLGIEMTTQDTASFLEALDLKPIDVGTFSIGLGAQTDGLGMGGGLDTIAKLGISNSTVLTKLSSQIVERKFIVRGRLESPGVNVEDLQNAGAASIELAKLTNGLPPESGAQNIKPFVLPKPEPAQSSLGSKDEPSSDKTPFALPEELKELQLFDPEQLLQALDLEFDIDVKELSGPGGVASLDAPLSIKEGSADFGPLTFEYGGGSFDLSANMNLEKDPERVFVSGTTSGWDLGKIASGLDIDVPAQGLLNTYLDISLAVSSPQHFFNTVAGDVTVTMRDGAIGTSLIELSGLGIFPWLFSKELAQGYSRIVCVKAPIKLSPGRADFSQVVLETDKVQLVSKGSVDWRRNAVDIRAEPRRIGRPLSRSAWPFTITGQLTNPTFDVESGGERPKSEGGRQRSTETRTPCEPDILQLSE